MPVSREPSFHRPHTTRSRFLRRLIEALRAANAGDFSTTLSAGDDAQMQEAAELFNRLMAREQFVVNELSRVSRSVGREGRMSERVETAGLEGSWAMAVDSVNGLIADLVQPTFEVSRVIKAVAEGDLTQKLELEIQGKELQGEFVRIGSTVNRMVDQLNSFASEVTRVAREVGTEGVLGGQANVPEVGGTWKDLTDSVNAMASNLTNQVRNIALVTTAVANGDLSQHITVEARGEVLELKNTINTMVDQLSAFAAEVTRVAREVGTEGVLGGQATVSGVAGTWKGLTDNVNAMANNLTNQVRNIALVTTAVANGDLSQKIAVEARGEVLDLKNTINDMVEKLRIFANEVIRVSTEVGTEGRLGGQATVPGVGGTWKDLTENVNAMAGNLTVQVRNIADVTTAVARGDLSRKITVDVRGEILELKDTVNAMVDQLNAFAGEVTRVAREVGTEGKLGGQATVPGAAGVWRDLTDNVNGLAANLTTQVRNIADVTTAVANGDLSQKITVEAQGEVLSLKMTINNMVDRLRVFGDEVTRVAKEVGTEGKLGGQAEVPSVSGTWKMLTDSVNAMANSLTVQVRNIADVTTAVTKGDLTRQITVNARGELDELKQNMNQMISNLRETTQRNKEQDWLKTNLAKFTQMMQGQKDLKSVSQLIMSELTPLVSAQTGAFFLMENEDDAPRLRLIASYAYRMRRQAASSFALGDGIVGQAALEKKQIVIQDPPEDYIEVASGLGKAAPRNIVVLPILFEGEVKAVIELASFQPFSENHQAFLDQLAVSLGVVLNMIQTSMRTEELLEQSQKLTQELQSSSTELQDQQDELKRSNRELEAQARTLQESQTLLKKQQEELRKVNGELEEKAAQLADQNAQVEQKNREVEASRIALEEKAEQLAVSSRYKSEFLANVSHEFRTPLNSLLILAKLLAENKEGRLSPQQVEFAQTIYSSGRDLLELINDVLDLSKVEAGKMDVNIQDIPFAEVGDFLERTFQPLAAQKGLDLQIRIEDGLPASIQTDRQRLEQVLKNLLSNAIKFTERGEVVLDIRRADPERRYASRALDSARSDGIVAFTVRDTGIGISKEKQQLIFEAFQQADGTTNRKYGGTGLGLTISRDIAALLHGEIAVESEPNQGSTFTLYLPIHYLARRVEAPREAAATEAPPLARPEGNEDEPATGDALTAKPAVIPSVEHESAEERGTSERAGPGTLAGKHALIVDDDVRNIFSLTSVLEDRGMRVSFAENGRDAITLLESTPGIDIVLMDIMMPDMDGYETTREIRRRPGFEDLPIIALTAKAMKGDRENAIAAGASDYIAKPVESSQLVEVISQWLKR